MKQEGPVYFSEHFEIAPETLERYGAFNIAFVSDIPLFIDPFRLFNSKKPIYQELHKEIIGYLLFLRNKAIETGGILVEDWYRFGEVRQTWLGFSKDSNRGHGLGGDFAETLKNNFRVLSDFGTETQTKGTHLEKLCLMKEGVGRDNISDFTTNLIKEYLVTYTQKFCEKHIEAKHLKDFAVPKVRFNYKTESWESSVYRLPAYQDDFVLLTPIDILTKDRSWICREDLLNKFERIPEAIPNAHLRAQINNYFWKALPRQKTEAGKDKEPTRADMK